MQEEGEEERRDGADDCLCWREAGPDETRVKLIVLLRQSETLIAPATSRAIREYLLSRFVPRRDSKVDGDEEELECEQNRRAHPLLGRRMRKKSERNFLRSQNARGKRKRDGKESERTEREAKHDFEHYFEERGQRPSTFTLASIPPTLVRKETKISEGAWSEVKRKERKRERKQGTCSSSVPRDAFFYAPHFLRF